MVHTYPFGIEEEYFLADAETFGSPREEIADRFHRSAGKAIKEVEHELLKGQVEVATTPGTSPNEAYEKLAGLRCELSRLARDEGLLLFAAGSHPCGISEHQHTSSTKRYERLKDELQLIAPRAMVCATHVHVEVTDANERQDLIKRLLPFLPLLLALSTSSPFWERHDSGLKCFRLASFAQWPRTGLPILFDNAADYDRYASRLSSAGLIPDASFLWWHIRPSVHYPTIEMRVCDSCTNLEDAVAIASLYRCLIRAVERDRTLHRNFGTVELGLCAANIWQAQQDGVEAQFLDVATDRILTVAEMLEETSALVREDAAALGVSEWLQKLHRIVEDGTSADRQVGLLRSLETDTVETVGSAAEKIVARLAEETIDVP